MKGAKKLVFMLISGIVLSLFLTWYPVRGVIGAEQFPYPSLEDRMQGKIATIEQLTGGKVKVGDLIDKTNADLVKDLLPAGVYECIQQGKVIRINQNPPPLEVIPKFFVEATEKNSRDVKMDELGTVYHGDGSNWKGGVPFPEPTTGLEAGANIKYGLLLDDMIQDGKLIFVNKEGKVEKSYRNLGYLMKVNGRLHVPPLGSVPGHEKEMRRKIMGFSAPLEMAGVGQLTIRHYDENKYPDAGFAYVPAFKRTIRQCASTWQQNVGGSDMLWCDAEGISDPFAEWNFKLLGKKYMLLGEFKAPHEMLAKDWTTSGQFTPEVKFDVGQRFPRLGFAVVPAWVVEITPKGEHPYSKKILYITAYPYWQIYYNANCTDAYDVQGKLWKAILAPSGELQVIDGDTYASSWGVYIHDLQTGHSTLSCLKYKLQSGLDIDQMTVKTLVEIGR
jgi:hypothetical protein